MARKTRLIILLACGLFFFITAPAVVVYSLGYRLDFERKKISATGGVFIKAWPESVEVFIDSKFAGKTKLFAGSIFAQNLLPKQHNILVKKEGYFPYQKTLDVKEKEVVKIEHILLFKENIQFEELKNEEESPFKKQGPVELFVIKNGKLYKNSQEDNQIPLLKNVVASDYDNKNITWLGADGLLYASDQEGKNTKKLSLSALKINKNSSYKLFPVLQNIFLFENDNLFLFSEKTKEFVHFYSPVKKIELSPDSSKLMFYNDYEILFSFVNQLPESKNQEKIFLNRFSEKIGQCLWLNNDYIIFTVGRKIKISETDNKNNINIVTLPEETALPDGTTFNFSNDGKNPEIYFDRQTKILHIFSGNKTLYSEKILP